MGIAENVINLTFRFLLEMGIIFSFSYWGWTQFSGILRWIMSLTVPLTASILWATFRVNGDPGKAPVPVPGVVRLLLEFLLFGLGIWALYAAHKPTWGLIFGILIIIHYIISYNRIIWLFKQ